MQNSRSKQTKEKRNPLLDQVKHTGLTHFKPNLSSKNYQGNKICTLENCSDDDDDDDDEDISKMSGRLKAISDRYLKSSTHRFLAKFYKNSSSKSDKSTETEESNKDDHKISKVSTQQY